MSDKHRLWVEKFRPTSIDDYIFHNPQQRASFVRMINDKTVPHLLLAGVQGSGKTTIAQILIGAMGLDDSDVLVINASLNNSVDDMRDQIYSFVVSFALGPFKIVCLEEADFITPNGQAVMRKLMEDYSEHARFILTCNYDHKIIPAIKSRCQEFKFKAVDKNDIAEYCINILAAEHIQFSLTTLDKYIAFGYPDIRKIVNSLQQNAIDGSLQEPHTEGTIGDWKFDLLDLIERDKWVDARKLVCGNVDGEEWVEVYRFLYRNLKSSPKFADHNKWEEGIVTISKHLRDHGLVDEPEINAAAMFISLGQL